MLTEEFKRKGKKQKVQERDGERARERNLERLVFYLVVTGDQVHHTYYSVYSSPWGNIVQCYTQSQKLFPPPPTSPLPSFPPPRLPNNTTILVMQTVTQAIFDVRKKKFQHGLHFSSCYLFFPLKKVSDCWTRKM